MLYLHGECCEQSKSVHTWTKCLYLYGECCEESKSVHQNVYTYMVNVVRRANIKMFIGLNGECCEQSNYQNVYLYGECCEQSKSAEQSISSYLDKMFILTW